MDYPDSSLYFEKVMPNKSIRYYKAFITRDLFDIVVLCEWGTIGTRLGGSKSYPVSDLSEAGLKMDEIKKRRAQRGYKITVK
jgi:hypothetical protein